MKTLLLFFALSLSVSADERIGESKEQLSARWGEAITVSSVDAPASEAARFTTPVLSMTVQFWDGKAAQIMVTSNDDSNRLKSTDVPALLKQLAGSAAWNAVKASGSSFVDSYTREDGGGKATFLSLQGFLIVETTAFIKAKDAAKDKARADAIKGL